MLFRSDPVQATNWVKAQLGNRASQVTSDCYVGLFSSQQMVVQNRLTDPPLRQALAKNPVVKAKIAGGKIEMLDMGEITDDGLEELGLVLPCDDSQLRVVQLSDKDHSLQVEGPPGTGKIPTEYGPIQVFSRNNRRVGPPFLARTGTRQRSAAV